MKIFALDYLRGKEEIHADVVRIKMIDGPELEIQPWTDRHDRECLKITSVGRASETIKINPVVSNQIIVSFEDA
jgi:hypothetical protein